MGEVRPRSAPVRRSQSGCCARHEVRLAKTFNNEKKNAHQKSSFPRTGQRSRLKNNASQRVCSHPETMAGDNPVPVFVHLDTRTLSVGASHAIGVEAAAELNRSIFLDHLKTRLVMELVHRTFLGCRRGPAWELKNERGLKLLDMGRVKQCGCLHQ